MSVGLCCIINSILILEKSMRLLCTLLAYFVLTACASVNSLPQTANEVDFDEGVEGKTGWSEYQGLLQTAAVRDEVAYEAAKAGLRAAGFTVNRADISNRLVLGKHGMTAYDWNVVAGIYYRIDDDQTRFKMIVEGSKDLGFSGDATGTDWVGRIQGGIRNYISTSVSEPESSRAGSASGTCFAVSPDGKLVTNQHVIKDAREITVILASGQQRPARVIAQSASTDLAVLKVDMSDIDFLPISEPRSADVGMEVFTVGFPMTTILGSQAKFTDGTISALSGLGGEAAFMQISVPLQPGNSGGPLVNNVGQVVGITTSTAAVGRFIQATGSLPQNVNWAVKSEYALLLFDKLDDVKPAETRAQAIARATAAACRVVADR